MILADKIMEERKRNGWSQEELAEKLDVSRQSVSKWESAQSVPDINRILQMAELFHVSTDRCIGDVPFVTRSVPLSRYWRSKAHLRIIIWKNAETKSVSFLCAKHCDEPQRTKIVFSKGFHDF